MSRPAFLPCSQPFRLLAVLGAAAGLLALDASVSRAIPLSPIVTPTSASGSLDRGPLRPVGRVVPTAATPTVGALTVGGPRRPGMVQPSDATFGNLSTLSTQTAERPGQP